MRNEMKTEGDIQVRVGGLRRGEEEPTEQHISGLSD